MAHVGEVLRALRGIGHRDLGRRPDHSRLIHDEAVRVGAGRPVAGVGRVEAAALAVDTAREARLEDVAPEIGLEGLGLAAVVGRRGWRRRRRREQEGKENRWAHRSVLATVSSSWSTSS